MKKRDNSIGQATVYRTLKLLNESGLIEPLDFADGVTRYEPSYGEEHHDHLICERCGRNIEILDKTIENRQEELAAKHGFTLVRTRCICMASARSAARKKASPPSVRQAALAYWTLSRNSAKAVISPWSDFHT